MEDILYYRDHFNETAKQLNVDADLYSYSCKGKAYGYDCRATLGFYNTNNQKEYVLTDITLYFDTKDLNNAYEFFSDMFDGAVDYGMEPYAESNGGAVSWYVFEEGNITYRLSSASKLDYVTLNLKENPNPVNAQKTVLGKYKGLTLDPEGIVTCVNSYESGVLNISITNNTDEDMTLVNNPVLYEGADGDSFMSMTPMFMHFPEDDIVIHRKETVTLNIRLRDYGKLKAKDYLIKLDYLNIYFNLKEAR